jgi:hypothetical protein
MGWTVPSAVTLLCAACAASPQVGDTPAPGSPPLPAPAAPVAVPPAGGSAAGAPAAGAPDPGTASPAAAPRFADADALLEAVERSAAAMRDFRAAITLETADEVTGDVERRLGSLVLVQEEGKPATRRFAVVFDRFIDGAGRMDERPVRYLYADGWLTEADFTQRTLVRRQLARPGEAYDPLKPGEGPVPLPIGQRREDVLARFDASIAAAPRAAAIAKLGRPLAGLALRPKPGTADRDLKDAVVWYDAETLAPVAVEATRAGGRTTVVLRNATVNGGLDDAQRALLTLAAGSTEGWRVDERPLPPEAPR